MTDVRKIAESCLKSVLDPLNIEISYGVKSNGKSNPCEYVVYIQQSDIMQESVTEFQIRNATIRVSYYISDNLIKTEKGKTTMFNTTTAILNCMKDEGFSCQLGVQDIGDIEYIGYATYDMIFEYVRIEDGCNP